MEITRSIVADKLTAYLHRELPLAELVAWAEDALLDGELAATDAVGVRSVLARLGVADVREFGLTWDECETLLRQLGYSVQVEVVAV